MGAPQNSGPAWIDTVRQPQFRGFENSSHWLVRRGSALYLWQNFPFAGTSSTHTGVYKSLDDGSTWNILDGANSPDGTGTPYYDVANNRWVGALVFTPLIGALNPMFMQTFNFLTETWGPTFNTGGPNSLGAVDEFLVRPDGTYVVLFEIGAHALLGQSQLKGSIVPSTLDSWGAVIDVGHAIVPFISNGNVLGSTAVVDTSGNTHVFFQDSNKTHFLYQQLLANNTLGPSFHWAAATLNNPNSIWGETLIFNGVLYTPFVAGSFLQNSYVSGSPLSSPVFTINTPASVQRPLGITGGTSLIQTDGITLYWCVNWSPSFQFTKYQVFTSTDGVNWTLWPDNATAPYLYDFATSPLVPNIDNVADQITSMWILFPNVVGTAPKGYLFSITKNLLTSFQTVFLNAELFLSTPQSFSLSLFGWKLFKKDPCDTSTHEVQECPPVKRAV